MAWIYGVNEMCVDLIKSAGRGERPGKRTADR
jgi:hypothetical protein